MTKPIEWRADQHDDASVRLWRLSHANRAFGVLVIAIAVTMVASSCVGSTDLAIGVSDDMYLVADEQLVSDQRELYEASLFVDAFPVERGTAAEILGPRQILSNAYVNELARELVANTGDIHDLVRAHNFSDLVAALARYDLRAAYAQADDRRKLYWSILVLGLESNFLGEGLVMLALMQAHMLDIPGGGVSLSPGPDGISVVTVTDARGAESQIRLEATPPWQHELREALSAAGTIVAVDGPDWFINSFLNVVADETMSDAYRYVSVEFFTSIEAARS